MKKGIVLTLAVSLAAVLILGLVASRFVHAVGDTMTDRGYYQYDREHGKAQGWYNEHILGIKPHHLKPTRKAA